MRRYDAVALAVSASDAKALYVRAHDAKRGRREEAELIGRVKRKERE